LKLRGDFLGAVGAAVVDDNEFPLEVAGDYVSMGFRIGRKYRG